MARVLISSIISYESCSSLTRLIVGPARLLSFRGRSGRPEKAEFIEIDLSGKSDSDSVSFSRLEEALQNVVIRRSAPDWIHFRPGTSYFVPLVNTRVLSPIKIVELVGDGLNSKFTKEEEDVDEDREEDALSAISGARGWPSSNYFIKGRIPKQTRNSDEDED